MKTLITILAIIALTIQCMAQDTVTSTIEGFPDFTFDGKTFGGGVYVMVFDSAGNFEYLPEFAFYGKKLIVNTKEKPNCSFVIKYKNGIIAKGNNVEFNFKEDPVRKLYSRGKDGEIKPILTSHSPDCIVSFRIDKRYDNIFKNTFFEIDKPTYFEIDIDLYYPDDNCVVKGWGYITSYYRLVCQMEVLSGDAELIFKK